MRIAIITLGLAAACMAIPAIAADPPAAPAAPAKKAEAKPATQSSGRTDPECPEGTNQNAGSGKVLSQDTIVAGGSNKPIPKPRCEAKLQKLPTPAK